MKKLLLALTLGITAAAAVAATGSATLVNDIMVPPSPNSPIFQVSLKTGDTIKMVEFNQDLHTLVPANSTVDTLSIPGGQKIQAIKLPAQCKVTLQPGQVLVFTGHLTPNRDGKYTIPDLKCYIQ